MSRLILVTFFASFVCTSIIGQSFAAFQRLDSCSNWRCVVGLSKDVSLRLDRSIPWRLPLRQAARVSSTYGYRVHPIDGQQKFHGGVDIAAPLGSSILASGSGTVTTGFNAVLGHYVTIDHLNGFTSTYGHLDQILVSPGASVDPDSVIGTVGESGRTTGPHLHWSVRHTVSGSLNPLELRSLFLESF